MTFHTLIFRSLRFHWRSHLGVVLGAAVSSAALVGALVVGDSVKLTLRQRALERLGGAELALDAGDRFFEQTLANRMEAEMSMRLNRGQTNTVAFDGDRRVTSLLRLPGMAARQDGNARANQVQVWGISDFRIFAGQTEFDQNPKQAEQPRFKTTLPAGSVMVNHALAQQLRAKIGDAILLRIHKPSALSRDAVITPRDDASIGLRLTVDSVIAAEEGGNLSLTSGQAPPLNAFVQINELRTAAGATGRANVLLVGSSGRHSKLVSNDTKRRLNEWLAQLSPQLRLSAQSLFEAPEPVEQIEASRVALRNVVRVDDYELSLEIPVERDFVELRSRRIFLDEPLVAAATTPSGSSNRVLEMRTSSWEQVDRHRVTNSIGILTYLANLIGAGTNAAPYSMVAAAGPPYVPADLRDDEILINQWLADDLRVDTGDEVELSYYVADSGSRLLERTNRFRVRAIVPLEGLYADRSLMPEFPGLAKAESTHDWDAGFPLQHKIREKDEAYWKEHRGTPKAFISIAAGRNMWGNRFGNLTAIRWPVPEGISPGEFRGMIQANLMENLDPAQMGLSFQPVRAQALVSADEAQDFGGLFLGFSFFLIAAALILMALLFQFGLEQRTSEVGTLLALGYAPKQVRCLFLGEGTALALLGGIMGVFGGVAYARTILQRLAGVWREAIASTPLNFYVTLASLVIGLVAGVLVCAIMFALVLRRQARRPARELLAETSSFEPRISSFGFNIIAWSGLVAALAAIALVGWTLAKGEAVNAGAFFGAGSLVLIAGLAGCAALLTALARRKKGQGLTLAALGLRGCTRRRTRSLATISLLAGGSFIVVAIAAFKLEANLDAWKRASGTGGFALIGETALPVLQDLNTSAGREAFGLADRDLEGVSFVPLRVREGDDASCLNLSRAQRPRLLGVKGELLTRRGAFNFTKAAKGFEAKQGWRSLMGGLAPRPSPLAPQEVPAVGDANSIQWALGKKLGDTLDYIDERGRAFKVRLVGAVANSILQGSLIIDEAEFVKRFPGESGYRMFLIDVPSNRVSQVSAALSRALQDVGFEVTPATQRLAQFNAVQNTYLNTFQVLGGLGLLLGSAGLGVVVLRNVLERRAELGLLQALGFRRRALHRLVLSEHTGLLAFGLAIGVVAAVVAILPALLSPGAQLPWTSMALTLGSVLVSGLAWTWIATAVAMRGELLKALRNE